MVFSDTTNKNGILQLCETLTGLGDGTITTDTTTLKKQFGGFVNQAMHELFMELLNAQDDWDLDDSTHGDFPELTTPLVENQRGYTIPASEKVLKIKRVDICWNGTGNTCYRANPIDSGEIGFGMGNDTDVDARFSEHSPRYDVTSNAVLIYPRASASHVTNSGVIKLEWTRELDEYVVTTDDALEPLCIPAGLTGQRGSWQALHRHRHGAFPEIRNLEKRRPT